VARLIAEVSAAAGMLLSATASCVGNDHMDVDRGPALRAEARARAALIELLDQYRRRPGLAEAWVGRFGVALHARAASDALTRLPELVPGPAARPGDVRLVAFCDQLADAATLVRADLDPGRGHPDRPRAPRLDASTRDVAAAAIDAAHGDAPAVVRAVLARDWIIGVARMVDHRP